ncbi:MAG: hypothetical protein R3B06_31630 [Kofleriaceae bacterium]
MKRTQVMSSLTMALAAAMLAIPAAPMGALAAPVTTGPRAGGPGASPLVRATERDLEVAAGPPVRSTPLVQAEAPSLAKLAWTQFLDRHGSWDAQWDTQSGVPVRIWGEGIATPGANADAARAEAAARQLLAEQLELLAPGTRTDDFKLTANVVHGGLHGGLPMRTVTFTQHVDGAPVIGAGVGFLFKNDRLFVISSSAVPRTSDRVPRAALADGVVAAGAEAWVTRATGIPARAIAAHAEVRWLPLYRTTGAVELAAVRSVTVAGTDPARPGRWDVYVDAGTGAPVARATLLRFATGTMTYRVPARSPQRPRIDAPVPFANFRIGATTVPSDGGGVVTWTGTSPVQVTTSLAGAKVAISNAAGALASATLTLAPGGSASWDRSTVANDDAQLATYIFVNTVKAYAKANLNPTMSYLDQQLSATVNESGSCNAYSTGDDIHFFPASNQCENTGRIADVVYHEFGHSLHAQSIIPGVGDFDGALSEGVSDYLAATITNDAGMGRGFFFNDSALRNLDPAVDLRYPDDLQGEPHADGEIIAGTLWDVRTAMIEAYGPAAGVTKADDIYYAIIQRASSIPTTYAEALAVDDDDGNLANGTPTCACCATCSRGTAWPPAASATGGSAGAPVRAGFQIGCRSSRRSARARPRPWAPRPCRGSCAAAAAPPTSP